MAPWQSADAAAERAGVDIVRVVGMEDAGRGVDVVERLWGEAILPRELVRAFAHAGGTVLVARSRDGRADVGFVLGFVGWDERLHVHSHILGVSPEWQSRGVGFALKLAQRAESLDHGIEEVRWTYDPLVARNARFNLVKLGTVATRFLPGFYGEMRDVVNRGDRSDRFEVRWFLRSPRVERALAGDPVAPREGPALLEAKGDASAGEPVETGALPGPGAGVAIPPDYERLRRDELALARRWRAASARVFERCFDQGLVATWISRDGMYRFVAAEAPSEVRTPMPP